MIWLRWTARKKIISAAGEKIEFDLLVSIPPNVGARYLVKSDVAMDEIGYVKTNNPMITKFSWIL